MSTVLKDRAALRLSKLAACYESNLILDPAQDAISLLNGRGSTVLIQSILAETLGEPTYRYHALNNFEYVVDRLESAPLTSFSHCNGASGVGWLILYLHEKALFPHDVDEFVEDLDLLLRFELQKMLAKHDMDLMHGAMGIGLYFLKRGVHDMVGLVVDALYQSAHLSADEIRWFRHDKYVVKEDIYDLGLAHGNASIIYFLKKCYTANVAKQRCKELLLGSIRFFMNNINDAEVVGSFFNSSILVRQYGGDYPRTMSRLAWCYGDLGILVSLIDAAACLREKGYQDKFEEMLAQVSTRRAYESTRVLDAGFCHGASGVGYLYLKAYRLTGNIIFLRTAEFWIEKALDMALDDSRTGPDGYLFSYGESGWRKSLGLLSGSGGVCLLLIAYLFDKYPNEWDESLFLS